MYRRMNHFLAILAFLVMMLVIPALTFGMDASGGLAMTYMSGHDHGGSHSVDPGVATVLMFNEKILGASLYWLHFETKSDSEGNKTEDAYILAVHLSPSFRITDKWRVRPVLGPTLDLEGRPGVLGGMNLEYWIKDIAVCPGAWYIKEMDRNYRGFGVSLRYAF